MDFGVGVCNVLMGEEREWHEMGHAWDSGSGISYMQLGLVGLGADGRQD